jgi:hypothetical protein
MSEPTLFPDLEPLTPAPVEKLSAGRRLTLRQKADVEAGRHPLTGSPVLPGHTCGTCIYRVQSIHGYPKCDAYGERYWTASARTDVRAWWPACERWTQR